MISVQHQDAAEHANQVKIQLRINGQEVPVAQLGPDFIYLESPCAAPSGNAELVLKVDKKEIHWDVILPEGIKIETKKVRIQKKDPPVA